MTGKTTKTAVTKRYRSTHAGRTGKRLMSANIHVRRKTINGKQARKLRRIATELGRPSETKWAFAGELRRKPSSTLPDGRVVPGAPIRRPIHLMDCQRRAEQECKKIFNEERSHGR